MEKAMAPLQYSCLGNLVDGGACSPWGRGELETTERLHFHFSLSCIGEGSGKPLQCSCLENPREPGGLPSMGSHRVGHDWSDSSSSKRNWAAIQCREIWGLYILCICTYVCVCVNISEKRTWKLWLTKGSILTSSKEVNGEKHPLWYKVEKS